MEKNNNETPNMGSGTTQIFNFNGDVHQFNKDSHVVNEYIYGSDGEMTHKTTAQKQDPGAIDKPHIREEIIKYVGGLFEFYTSDWQKHYIELWNDILLLPEVDAEIFELGKQHDTLFNRNLVGNIISFLNRYKLYKDDFNANAMTKALLKYNNKGQSVREALGDNPPTNICEAIKKHMDTKKYF
ncbi:MAG: hypothetical protein K6A94_13095 [Bacteroidales bacterium]|nr:hypothetical protein [Bacteroidales bacterium]